jgi:hypothetical protein
MHLIVDYQKRFRESSDSVQAAEENARKFSMEVFFFLFANFHDEILILYAML